MHLRLKLNGTKRNLFGVLTKTWCNVCPQKIDFMAKPAKINFVCIQKATNVFFVVVLEYTRTVNEITKRWNHQELEVQNVSCKTLVCIMFHWIYVSMGCFVDLWMIANCNRTLVYFVALRTKKPV